MMNNILANYAFVTTLYNQKRNFLDTYTPFVLKTLYEADTPCSDSQVKKYLEDYYGLSIPKNTVKAILKQLNRVGEISLDTNSGAWSACIIQKGKIEVESHMVEERDILRKQNEFFAALGRYLEQQMTSVLSRGEIESKTFRYISENVSKLTIFDSENTLEETYQNGFNDPFNFHLTNFIASIEQTDSLLYKTFEEIVRGSVINGFMSSKEDMEEFRAFEPIEIYLDANVILSLLGFHDQSVNDAARELYDLLKGDRSITLKVFTITLEEISRLLTSYKYRMTNYNPRIPVNSVFYYLRAQGFDEARTDDLIQTIDRRVEQMGIMVEKQSLIDPGRLSPGQKELYLDLYSYKNQRNNERPIEIRKDEQAIHLSALHDASIIWHIRRKRGSWVKQLERSKAIFLTSSHTLDVFTKQRQRITNSFPEVILDLTLTNIIWLRNPHVKVGLPLHKLIAVHSKKFIVDNGIWNRFINTIKKLRSEKKIDQTQYAGLFSSNQLTQTFLLNAKYEQINDAAVMDLSTRIERTLKSQEENLRSHERQLNDKDKELQDKAFKIDALEKKLSEQQTQSESIMSMIEELRHQDALKAFTSQYLDLHFYPLGKRAIWVIVLVVMDLVLVGVAEVFDSSDLGVSERVFKAVRWVSLIGLSCVVAGLSKLWSKDFWRYYFDYNNLKREKCAEAEERFANQARA